MVHKKNISATLCLTLIAGVIVATTAVLCSAKAKPAVSGTNQTAQTTPATPQNTAEPTPAAAPATEVKKQLLFFMNPNGRPCQMQDAIIHELGDSIRAHANLRYYKTTEQSDRQAFGTYGIRGLPSLIVLDQNGRELHRFTPGVQEGSAILEALR